MIEYVLILIFKKKPHSELKKCCITCMRTFEFVPSFGNTLVSRKSYRNTKVNNKIDRLNKYMPNTQAAKCYLRTYEGSLRSKVEFTFEGKSYSYHGKNSRRCTASNIRRTKGSESK